MEQVVLKQQNLPEQLSLSGDSPCVEGCDIILNLDTKSYVIDPHRWRILEAIQTTSGQKIN